MPTNLLKPSDDDVMVVTQQALTKIQINNFLKIKEDEDEKNN